MNAVYIVLLSSLQYIYIYIYTGVLYVHHPGGKNRIVEDEANRQVPLSSANIVWLAI
jgi:hypothetical protein